MVVKGKHIRSWFISIQTFVENILIHSVNAARRRNSGNAVTESDSGASGRHSCSNFRCGRMSLRYSQRPWIMGYNIYAYIRIILYWIGIAFIYVVVKTWRFSGFNVVDFPVNTIWWKIFWRPLLLPSNHWRMQCLSFLGRLLRLLQQKCPINNARQMPWLPTWRGESTMPHARPLTPNSLHIFKIHLKWRVGLDLLSGFRQHTIVLCLQRARHNYCRAVYGLWHRSYLTLVIFTISRVSRIQSY